MVPTSFPTRSRYRFGPGFGLVIGFTSVRRSEVECCTSDHIHVSSECHHTFPKIRELLRQMGSGLVVTKWVLTNNTKNQFDFFLPSHSRTILEGVRAPVCTHFSTEFIGGEVGESGTGYIVEIHGVTVEDTWRSGIDKWLFLLSGIFWWWDEFGGLQKFACSPGSCTFGPTGSYRALVRDPG